LKKAEIPEVVPFSTNIESIVANLKVHLKEVGGNQIFFVSSENSSFSLNKLNKVSTPFFFAFFCRNSIFFAFFLNPLTGGDDTAEDLKAAIQVAVNPKFLQ